MKVMHLLQSSRFSGAENVVCQIISMYKESDIEFIYCSREGQIKEALEERGVRHNLMTEFSVSEIKRVIKEEKPDIIHAHDMKASFFAALICKKTPLISHIHNNSFDSRGLSIKSILYFFTGLKSKHIFWVSKSAYYGYKFHKSLENKSNVLYNIIDVDALNEKVELDKKEYNYDIVYLGRLSTPKNPHRLLKVFEKILEKRPKTKIAMIGTGEMEEEIKAEIFSNKNLSNVSFLGFNSNPYKILKDSKVMIMTSRWEGTPMCALEAMALGVPIVSTPTDGLKELVEFGITGYLSDDDQCLADSCLDIVSSKELRRNMSNSSIIKSRKMNNIENYKSKLDYIYSNSIKR
ncbi:glycosyltransferase [Clostridium perfringens]|uniref:glycosyltransferase n=1 Tax=Clostridium perfringens TaxID=1502 RepID=UPI0029711DE6|nr:glycosyltransferase [Clostridium perfringens]MDM0662785.1 glycosyltransferase [Clostridium perfringens]